MRGEDRGHFHPYLRSCFHECARPVPAICIKGIIPDWVRGSLLRNGPGLRRIGTEEFNHLFDGMAIMQKLEIRNGCVYYSSRFLKSDSFVKDMKNERIVVSEFGTRRTHPDPCLTLWQKFKNYFLLDDVFTDNCLVTFYPIGDALYAVTDSPFIRRIDPDDLETMERVDLHKVTAVNTMTSHAHVDERGNTYNMGSNLGTYNIVMFPRESPFRDAEILCQIPVTRPLTPSYYHSFGMTDSYFVLIEQPLVISLPHVMYEHRVIRGTSSNVWKWRPDQETRFWIVNRKTNQVLQTRFMARAFFFFHMINTYEDSGHLVVDVVTYENADLLDTFFVENIRESASDTQHAARMAKSLKSRAERFVIPIIDVNTSQDYTSPGLTFNGVAYKESDDMVQLEESSAKAILQKDHIFLVAESLTQSGESGAEMPTIHYDRYNGKKYRYFYALKKKGPTVGLMKCDVLTKSVRSWHETGSYASEPVFVPRPMADSGALSVGTRRVALTQEDREDDGVILSMVMSEADERKGFLLVLDAKTMKEVARADFATPSALTPTFHGIFLPAD